MLDFMQMEDKNVGNQPSQYVVLLLERKSLYKTWTPMFCTALRSYVHFGMRGFNHLRFNIDNTPRHPKEAMYKMGLLPLVKPVIYNATSAEYIRRLAPLGGTRKIVLREMDYWALTAVVGKQDVKVRVVLRKLVNSDQVHFWSVMKLGENQKDPGLDS